MIRGCGDCIRVSLRLFFFPVIAAVEDARTERERREES